MVKPTKIDAHIKKTKERLNIHGSLNVYLAKDSSGWFIDLCTGAGGVIEGTGPADLLRKLADKLDG